MTEDLPANLRHVALDAANQRQLLAGAEREQRRPVSERWGPRSFLVVLQCCVCWKQATSYCATTFELPELVPPWVSGLA